MEDDSMQQFVIELDRRRRWLDRFVAGIGALVLLGLACSFFE